MTYLGEIAQIFDQLPLVVSTDVMKRCGDWLASGGKENDPYIKQQLEYAKKMIKNKEMMKRGGKA